MNNRKVVVFVLAIITMMVVAFVSMASADTALYQVVTEDNDKVNVRDITEDGRILDTIRTGATIEVYAADKFWYYVEYEGVRAKIYKDYLIPVDGNMVVTPTKTPERTYSQEGCEHYRVKLTLKKFANVQNSPDVTGGTQRRLFEDDDVWVKSFFTRDGIRWATIILESGQKRYIEARLIEAVTDETERLSTPNGEYVVTSEDAQILSKARTRQAKTIRNLHIGDHVTVIADDGAWVKVEFVNEKGKVTTGEVRSRYLEPVMPIATTSGPAWQIDEVAENNACTCGCDTCICGGEAN